MKKRVLSGIRSTGQLHLGNYFGALRNFVKLQEEAECFFFIFGFYQIQISAVIRTGALSLELNRIIERSDDNEKW